MTCCGKYIRILTFALLASGFHIMAFSQSDTLVQPGKNSTIENDSTYTIHSLYSSIGSGSNMISLNYSHVFNSWFDISSSIAGYKAPSSLQETLFSDFAFINLTTGFDWKLIYTKLSFGELISDDRHGYIQVRNSRYFETPEFFSGKSKISFDPNINILFGDLLKIETTTGLTKLGSSPPFRHFKKIPNSTIKSYSYKFGLMDFEFSLPVTFSYDKFSIEAEPSYILPSFSNSDYPAPEGFTFFINAFFRIL
jgi:hypothetical protein